MWTTNICKLQTCKLQTQVNIQTHVNYKHMWTINTCELQTHVNYNVQTHVNNKHILDDENWVWCKLIYQERRDGIPLTGLTPPHICACPKTGPGFSTPYVMVFFFWVFSELTWEVIVRFVDIGGIVDHYCLNFLFIILKVC